MLDAEPIAPVDSVMISVNRIHRFPIMRIGSHYVSPHGDYATAWDACIGAEFRRERSGISRERHSARRHRSLQVLSSNVKQQEPNFRLHGGIARVI